MSSKKVRSPKRIKKTQTDRIRQTKKEKMARLREKKELKLKNKVVGTEPEVAEDSECE